MNDVSSTYAALKALLVPYSPPLAARGQGEGEYHLWSEKPIEVAGRKKDEVYFAGLAPRKDYAAFYFMPVYANPSLKASLSPRLLALLKGKSCFHIKGLDEALAAEISAVLRTGYEAYRQRGWV